MHDTRPTGGENYSIRVGARTKDKCSRQRQTLSMRGFVRRIGRVVGRAARKTTHRKLLPLSRTLVLGARSNTNTIVFTPCTVQGVLAIEYMLERTTFYLCAHERLGVVRAECTAARRASWCVPPCIQLAQLPAVRERISKTSPLQHVFYS